VGLEGGRWDGGMWEDSVGEERRDGEDRGK
jgi:hypothetical protein